MKRYMTGVIVLLLVGMLVSCGGSGGDGPSGGSAGSGGGAGNNGGGGAGNNGGGGSGNNGGGGSGNNGGGSGSSLPSAGMRVEESDPAVTLSGTWTPANPEFGWSGGSAVQSSAAGSSVSLTFNGNSVTWFGARGREMAIALVSVDGGPGTEVDLYENTDDEVHSPTFTVNGLSDGTHTLTIQNTGRPGAGATSTVMVVDAFDVQGPVVSHLQDTNLDDITYSAGWTDASPAFEWSGGGAHNPPEPTRTAHVTAAAGETATLAFRGTSVSWVGYTGPDAGIATVQVDGGAPTEVDTFSPTLKVQQVVFTAAGLANANHTLKITATGRKNDHSTAAQIFVDAFDVRKPGRRYQEWDPAITYTGTWVDCCRTSRTWSEGRAAVTNIAGARANFRFTGTSVSWISSAKDSIGSGNVYLDGVFVRNVNLSRNFPNEDYQFEAFRVDGLTNGPHTLTIEATGNGGYIVIDAFDVNP